jgi:hypothetical protein
MSNLLLNLYGDFGNSEKIKPLMCKNKAHMEKYELNEDLFHFHFKKLDIGDIYKIKLVFNHPGPKEPKLSWYLNNIEINYDKKKFLFPHKKWLTTDKENKKVEIKLYDRVS